MHYAGTPAGDIPNDRTSLHRLRGRRSRCQMDNEAPCSKEKRSASTRPLERKAVKKGGTTPFLQTVSAGQNKNTTWRSLTLTPPEPCKNGWRTHWRAFFCSLPPGRGRPFYEVKRVALTRSQFALAAVAVTADYVSHSAAWPPNVSLFWGHVPPRQLPL